RDFGEILRRRIDAVIDRLAVLEFLFADIGILGREHLGHGLADGDLAAEIEGVAILLARDLDRDRLLFDEALRRPGQGLAADRKIDDEAVLALGILLGRVAEIERRRGDGLALP